MTDIELTDRCGRPRSPATLSSFRLGKKPGNYQKTYPADPLTSEEVLLLLNGCSRTCATGWRNRALFVVLWRSGLRISEALALLPGDIDHEACTVFVRRGKGAKARRVGIDARALEDATPSGQTHSDVRQRDGEPNRTSPER